MTQLTCYFHRAGLELCHESHKLQVDSFRQLVGEGVYVRQFLVIACTICSLEFVTYFKDHDSYLTPIPSLLLSL